MDTAAPREAPQGVLASAAAASAAARAWQVLRWYVFSFLLVVAATGCGMVADVQELDKLIIPLFLMAIALSAWYAGPGPGGLSVLLSGMSVAYFFTAPAFSFEIQAADRVYFAVFIVFAALIMGFAAKRRRVEADLRHARDELQAEVNLRAKQSRLLEQRTLELEASNKELEAFAYSTSHDLRAPLRHLVGFSELLRKHAFASMDEKGRRYVTNILEAGQRMGTLIDDLLQFSRIGRAEAQTTLVNLQAVVSEVRKELETETEGRAIEWDVAALPSVYGDRAMLRQAMANLLANAVKFTRTRDLARIAVGTAEGGPDEVVVFVRDNGVGFDMEYKHKLFGVFQRLHGSESFEGTGIGLATVQRILSRHGGRAWGEGRVGEGACFYCAFPRT